MNSKPRISIVMPTLNQAPYLTAAIDSVLTQANNAEIELIVMDGGSGDGTLAILESYGNRIRFISEPDKGQSDALNKGLQLVTGDIIGWLNSDDVYKPQAFQHILAAFTRAEVQWIYGKVDVINRQGQETRQWITRMKNRNLRHLSFGKLLTANWISQMGVFWRSEFLPVTEGLRTDYHLAMDYDLWLRLWEKCPGTFLDETLASFRIHESSKTGTYFSQQLREAFSIAKEHAGGRYKTKLAQHRLNSWLTFTVYSALQMLPSLRPASSSNRESTAAQNLNQ